MKLCKNVVIKPFLTLLTEKEFAKSSNTSSQARADLPAGGLWMNVQTAFCVAMVLNPLARCQLNHSLPDAHKKNENEKKRE